MKHVLLFGIIAFNYITAFAQVPQTINFQAQARGSDGKLLETKPVKIRFSVLEITVSGTPVYVETHSTTTDNSGMFNSIIGNGTAVQGTFKIINWAIQPKYLKIELDAGEGTGFKLISTFQLASVPYSLHAAKADTSMRDSDKQKLSVTGNQLSITNGNSITLPTASSQWTDISTGLSYNKKVGIGTNTPRSYLDVVSNDGNSQYSINASNTNSKGQAGMTAWNDNGGWLKLSLGGSQLADGAAFGQTGEATAQLLAKGAQDMLIGTLNDKSLVLGTNNLPRLTINSIGYFGLGTKNPLNKLDVRGESPDDGALITLGNSDKSHFLDIFGGRQNDPNPFFTWKEGDPLRFATIPDYTTYTGFVERMRISPNGNVGIGTSNPNQTLSVNGVIESTTGGMKFPDGTIQLAANNHLKQQLTLIGNSLTLSDNGGSVELPIAGNAKTSIISEKDLYISNQVLDTLFLQRFSTNPGSGRLSTKFNPNDWYYIAWTKATDLTGIIYINGNPVYTGTFNNDAYNHTQVYFGARFFTSFGSFLNGLIDEVRISNKARTPQEIKDAYNSNAEFSLDANTVALWHFNEGLGTSFSNAKGGSGVLSGNPAWDNGKFGKAVRYDGIDDYGTANFDPPENNTTYEAWVRFPNGRSVFQTIIQAYSTNNYDLMIGSVTNNKGMVMQSVSGACWQITIDDTGVLKSKSVPCPN